jgi:hypothetical protein
VVEAVRGLEIKNVFDFLAHRAPPASVFSRKVYTRI